MGEFHTTVRLTNTGADVHLGHVNFLVARRDDIKAGHSCPVAYITGALGS
jgi:hypothetical protein